MKRIKIYNTHLPVFCCGIEGRAIYVKEVQPQCDIAQGECECGNCGRDFHLVFPREMAGDLQYSLTGISGDLPAKCPACEFKGFVIVNEVSQAAA